MITFHTCGFTHEPHPGALARIIVDPPDFTDEVAVMIDTRRSLTINNEALSVENTAYVDSWKAPGL